MRIRCHLLVLLSIIYNTHAYEMFKSSQNSNSFNPNSYYQRPPSITNLTTLVGKTVLLNCTLMNNNEASVRFKSKLNPTWLKADTIYDQMGCVKSFNKENIIVTRKGIIASADRDKMKLITAYDERFQSLQISNVNVRNEGKYVCREFNSPYDKLFYINVYAPVSGLAVEFNTPSKTFPSGFMPNRPHSIRDKNSILPNSNKILFTNHASNMNDQPGGITIKENDILTVNCSVAISKPAANISIWLVPNNRLFSDKNSKKLSLQKFFTYQNEDMTLKSVAVAQFTVNRLDNQKSVVCVAENTALDEKWESKRALNVLYPPLCSQYQKKVYSTGINQSIELECRMTDANPQYLDFDWHFTNNQGHKDRSQSNGFISRVNWMPKKMSDFGEISCVASNGLESGECRMKLMLGGAPNPPQQCYHKENNKTIIIECVPGFDQGDPEVYFYLLKKKSNDVLVEYARKRDSCSFLISNLILEEHMNEFFVYSSNKYGNNREQAAKIVIENKEFLIKNSKKLQDIADEKNKRITLFVIAILIGIVFVSIFLCLLMKCHENNIKMKSYTHTNSRATVTARSNAFDYDSGYKYSSAEHYQTKTGVHIDDYQHNKKIYNDKYNDTSSSDFDQEPGLTYDRTKLYEKSISKKSPYEPSLLNNIQDLDMSPKSKRLSIKEKVIFESGCSRSMTEETTETESDNYFKTDDYEDNSFSVDHKKLNIYSPIKHHTITNTYKMNDINSNQNGIVYTISSKPSIKPNVWYGNNTDDVAYSSAERNLYAVERGFSTNQILDKRYSPETTNQNMDPNNEYRNYSDLVSDDRDNYDEDREENKLLQWPQTELPQLYSNETISLDIDEDKIVGILV